MPWCLIDVSRDSNSDAVVGLCMRHEATVLDGSSSRSNNLRDHTACSSISHMKERMLHKGAQSGSPLWPSNHNRKKDAEHSALHQSKPHSSLHAYYSLEIYQARCSEHTLQLHTTSMSANQTTVCGT